MLVHKAIPGRMTKFRIDELSGVDRPAQRGAVAVIMKREGDGVAYDPVIKRNFSDKQRQTLADSGKALPDGSFPIENEEDLHNAISAVGRAKNEAKAKAHIVSRAQSMGMAGALPDGWISKQGVNMDIELLRKALGLPSTATEADVATAIAKNAETATKLTKRATVLEVIAKARPKDMEFAKAKKPNPADDMEPDADDADGAKTKKFLGFMEKSEAERDALIADYAKGDETLTANGVTISKREVGDAAFSFMKAQQAQMEADRELVKKANEAAETATFEKRASEELAHTTGTLSERAQMLKAVASISDETARKAALAALHAGDALAKAGFERIGKRPGPAGEADPEVAIKAQAEAYQKAHTGMTFEKAYDAVMTANPEIYERVIAARRSAN